MKIPLLFTLILLSFSLSTFSLSSDGLALLALKSAITTDPSNSLSSWTLKSPTPCHFHGVICNTQNKVTSLSLSSKNLTGYIPSELGALLSLQILNLSHNNFSGPIPAHIFNATSLTTLDLSHNSLSGPIPAQITSLKNLQSLDLSSNSLNGSLLNGLSELTQLVGTLNLSFNEFSGEIPVSFGKFPVMVSLDLRGNNLSGKIPQVGSLLNQGPTAFSGNPRLCGFPLSNLCQETQNPNFVLPSNPENPLNPSERANPRNPENRVSRVSLPLIFGFFGVVVLGGVLFVGVWVLRKRKMGVGVKDKVKEGKKMGVEEDVVSHVRVVGPEDDEDEGQKGKFVVVDEDGFGLELEDLLRASAYVVGKSRSGIVYKVVVGGGKGPVVAAPKVVAVRRLSEGDEVAWRMREFEAEVEAIGKVHHPNVVRLRAYYYANDEKLLVSDFIRNGSLYTALHGGPSNDLPPLTWASRLKIAQGTAKGLLHIHECSPRKFVHGNFKSSKVLLDEDLHPYISGFGINRLVCGGSKSANPTLRRPSLNHSVLMGSRFLGPPSAAYMAPEVHSGGKFTQKCDVYSFGIMLMEMLTGKLPDAGPDNDGKGLESLVRKVFRDERPLSEIIDPALLHEVYAKKQVLAAFHIALNCTELDPELRPRMRTVSESLDRLKFQ